MKKLGGYSAVAGLILAILVHGISLFGFDIQEFFPFVWGLHILVFVSFVPTLILMMEWPGPEGEPGKFRGRRKLSLKMIKEHTGNVPSWFKYLVPLLFLYALLNFVFFTGASEGGGPGMVDGVHVIQNHGEIIRTITEEEYHLKKANELRGFSGHWMAFFSFSLLICWPFERKE